LVAARGAAREAAALLHWRGAARKLAEEAEQRGMIEAQLHQAQKMEAFGQFAGGMAHDFNNILHVITGSLDILQNRAKPADRPLLTRALDSANRGKKTIESMLTFARQQPLRSEAFDLNIVVREMESLLRPALESRVRLDIVTLTTPCRVQADRNQTELAILNLALNARDAMPDGGTLRVIVSTAHLSGQLAGLVGNFGTVAVQDTGTGMSPEVQARVFEPFFTTKGPSKGTGLGLSMVYGFVEQTRGGVTIDSTMGRGTTLVLYLPFGGQEFARGLPEPVGSTKLVAHLGGRSLAGSTGGSAQRS
jgi:signal transduction histidine kinase